MPRCWYISGVCLLSSAALFENGAAAEVYGRPLEAVPPSPHATHGASSQTGAGGYPPDAMRSAAGQPALPTPTGGRGRALRPQTAKQRTRADAGPLERMANLTGGRSISTVLGGLAIVVGAFLLVAWVLRRGMPHAASRLPGDVVEVLGHASITSKQSVHLIRLGNKLLLVALTPGGAEPLGEIGDPDEVTRIIGLCQSQTKGSTSAAFRQVFEDLGRGRTSSFFGNHQTTGRTA